MIEHAISRIVDGQNLTPEEARSAMNAIMEGQATDAQIGGFLAALRMKGETPEEVAAFAAVLREKALPVWEGPPAEVVDTCGTGGDRSGSFNISTAAAFVAAGAGLKVAKHGNRSASSRCGSADVIEALGLSIEPPIEALREAIVDIGFGFLFAPRFHGSTRHAAAARKQLGVRTVFNLLGPLSNPAGAVWQVTGVFSYDAMELVAQSLQRLGIRRALVVHADGGYDELSLSGSTQVLDVTQSGISKYAVVPEDFGLHRREFDALRGGDATTNARILRSVLDGDPGPPRDVVLMNTSAVLVATGRATDFKEGVRLAADSIDSGRAKQVLFRLMQLTPQRRT